MNRVLWLALTLFVVAALAVVTFFVVDLSDPQTNAALDVFLQFVSVATALAGLAFGIKGTTGRKRGQAQDRQPAERRGPDTAAVAGEPIAEAESLRTYVTNTRAYLESFGVDEDRFVTLSTAVDREPAVREIRPNLEWLERRGDVAYAQAERRPIELFNVYTLKHVVLLGDPGSGKSTCLRQIALRQLASAEARADDPAAAPLPLYASLSEWRDPSMNAVEFLQAQLAVLVGGYRNFYVANFETLLANGRFMLLLDGLNELPGRNASEQEGRHELGGTDSVGPGPQRPRASAISIDPRERMLRELASKAGLRTTFVMSCRSHEYFDSLSWQVVRVLPMTSAQIDAFVKAYTDELTATEVRGALRGRPALAEIASNPFFLQSIVQVFEGHSPPRPGVDSDSRGGIPDQLCTDLVNREQEPARGRTPRPAATGAGVTGTVAPAATGAGVTGTVARVAYQMLARGQIGDQASLAVGEEAKSWLPLMIGTGLLVDREGKIYFRHQIIQEYFAAVALQHRLARRAPATLLADKRFSEVVALWFDLDQDRLGGRLRRCLRARNLPWRRPRSMSGVPLYTTYQFATSALAVFVLAAYLLDIVLWPVHVLALPLGFLPFAPALLVVGALAIRPLLSRFVYHPKVITNAAYVLALARTESAMGAIDEIIVAFGRVWQNDRKAIAGSLARFGTTATRHAVRGLQDRNWRVRAGCVQALGELVRRNPDDALANEALVALAYAGDPTLVNPLTEALSWCTDARRVDAITAMLDRAGDINVFTASSRLEPLSKVGPTTASRWDQRILDRIDKAVQPDQPQHVRAIGLNLMGALQVPGYEERLASIAASEDALGATAAVAALARTQTESAVRRLITLGNQNPSLIEGIGSALRSVTNPDALPALIEGARSSEWQVKAAIASTLGSFASDDALNALRELATDDDEDVRVAVARGLTLANRSDAVPALAQLARDPIRRVRQEAIDLLSEHYPDMAPAELISLARDDEYVDRIRVIRRLGTYVRPEVREALRELSGDLDRSVRGAAHAAAQATRSGRPGIRTPGGSALRHPIMRVTRAINSWLELDDLGRLWRLEKIAGGGPGPVFNRVLTKIFNDAELTRHYRHAITVVTSGLTVLYVLVIVLVVATLRLTLWAAVWLLSIWYVGVAVVVVAGLTLLPGVALVRDKRLIGGVVALIRGLAGAILVIAVLGALVFTWWIWVFGIVAAGLIGYAVVGRIRSHAYKRLTEIVRNVEASVVPLPAPVQTERTPTT